MNYEERFKRFLEDLQIVIKKHIDSIEEAEQETYDVDTIGGKSGTRKGYTL